MSRRASRLVVALFAAPFLALAIAVTVGVWGRFIARLSALDGVVLEHGPTRGAGCQVAIARPTGQVSALRADPQGCAVLAPGRRVTKAAWSVTYATETGETWRLPAVELWLGGALGASLTGAWVLFLALGLSWRRRT